MILFLVGVVGQITLLLLLRCVLVCFDVSLENPNYSKSISMLLTVEIEN